MHFLHIFKDSEQGYAYFFGPHKTAMHIVEALIQWSCNFYDLRKIVVRNFEALAMGSNAHKAKWIKHACPM